MIKYSLKSVVYLSLLGFSLAHASENVLSEYKQLLKEKRINPSNQSLCFTADDTDFLYGADKKQNPASVTKLFASLWALRSLSAHFRFDTRVYIDDKDIYIKSGGDPYFMSQQVLLILKELSSQNHSKFNHLYIDTNLRIDWNNDSRKVLAKLHQLFNPKSWNQKIYQMIIDQGLSIKEVQDALAKISVKKTLNFKGVPKGTLKLTLKSPPLYRQLKEVNKYSNNFYFDQLASVLGGIEKFNREIAAILNINGFRFDTASGLGQNYLKCHHVLKLLKKLNIETINQQLSLDQVLPVVGKDRGTLEQRLPDWRGLAWAKTGTLRTTSALAGIIKRSDRHEYFVFLNSTGRLPAARSVQDSTLIELFQEFGDVISINYLENSLNVMKESLLVRSTKAHQK